jgi:hypothetical protein
MENVRKVADRFLMIKQNGEFSERVVKDSHIYGSQSFSIIKGNFDSD